MQQISKRLTYANVMSSIAVFLILGGATAFAAKKIGSNEIKASAIKTGKLAKEAVKAAKLAKNAVTTPKIANDAVTGEKVNESTLGTVPDASKLGGQSPSAFEPRVMWAIVNANGTEIVKQSGGISLAGHVEGGYVVRFPTSTENAAVQVTPTAAGFAGSPAGSVDAKAGPCPVSPDCAAFTGTTTNDAVVVTFAGGVLSNVGFYISLVP